MPDETHVGGEKSPKKRRGAQKLKIFSVFIPKIGLFIYDITETSTDSFYFPKVKNVGAYNKSVGE